MSEASPKGRHRIRENIDALAIAVLMAVLMKYFAIEAHQIPTSSMQPTMMGSKVAGIYDRILVDKSRYLLTEPKRFDIAVFHYPIRKSQNYVKRIVGMPGDVLRIGGGNIYVVREGGDPGRAADLDLPRRPASVLAEQWRNLFPCRAELHGDTRILGTSFQGSGGDWSESDGTLRFEPRSPTVRGTLRYVAARDGGLVNRVYDGYPAFVAKAMIDAGEVTRVEDLESVQDVRAAFTLTPQAGVPELRIEVEVNRSDDTRLTFALQAAGGEGRLIVERDRAEAAASEPFPLALPAGVATRIRFAHVDDRCIAEVDGDVVAELDCADFRSIDRLTPLPNTDRGSVFLRLTLRADGPVAIDEPVVDRDLHYLPSSRPGPTAAVFHVPERHYFMMGDNTQQSVDSRDWTAITLGMDEAGRLVDPQVDDGARALRGNLRAMDLTTTPDPDENPVPVIGADVVVFTDDAGEVWSLDGQVAMSPSQGPIYGQGSPWFTGADGEPWTPEHELVHFVPREDIIGRPLVTFWPAWPWFRIGFVR